MQKFLKNRSSLLLLISLLIGLLNVPSCMDETPDDIKTIEGNIPIGPYLQNLNSSSVSILWSSLDDVGGRVIIQDMEGKTIGEFKEEGIFHSIRVTGLEPATEYTYQVKEGTHRIKPEGHFKTPPLRNAVEHRYAFAVFGDSGTGSKAQYEVAHQMRLFDPDFVLHVGDIVYPNGDETDYYGKFFRPYQDLIVNKVFWMVLGNHDYQSSNGKPFEKFFVTPANNKTDNERFYSFEYGNALFIALDSVTLSENEIQQEFLETTLAASKHTWRFIFLHQPPYSSGNKHGSNLKLREQISFTLEMYDVDMVFAGHDHHYERTSPREDYVQDGYGTIYIISGGGGAELSGVGFSGFTEYAVSVYHFVGIQIDGKQLDLQAIDNHGNVFDEFHLEKTIVP